ncbi:MAG: hypothetical protein HY667_00360 [Chloroflexi bacterium]|nr:hypothetical protein [Chloroflexota bacterium]
MSNRVYVVLDVIEGKAKQVACTLLQKSGVMVADVLDSPPGVMMVVEASERKRLAELTVQAIASVNGMMEGLRLLPVQDEVKAQALVRSYCRRASK